MGPIVQSMGFGAFTTGSFQSQKAPWAVPKYVRAEPTGVHGFGADVAGCKPADVAAKEMWAMLKPHLRGVAKFDLGFLGTVDLADADDLVLPVLTQGIVAGAQAAKSGRGSFESWFKGLLSKMNVPTMFHAALVQKASAQIFDGMAALEVCTAPAGAATYEDQIAPQTQYNIGTITTVAKTPEQLRQLAMVAATPQMTAALKALPVQTKSPISTPVLIGAAALAALFLLR